MLDFLDIFTRQCIVWVDSEGLQGALRIKYIQFLVIRYMTRQPK